MLVETRRQCYRRRSPSSWNHYRLARNRLFAEADGVVPLRYFDSRLQDDWTRLQVRWKKKENVSLLINVFYRLYCHPNGNFWLILPVWWFACICDSEWPKGNMGLCGGPTTSSSLSSSSIISWRDWWPKWLGARELVTCVGFNLSESDPPRCANSACLQLEKKINQ